MRRILSFSLALVFLLSGYCFAQEQNQKNFSKNKFIVKFKSDGKNSLNECAVCLLADKKKFKNALASQSGSLDRLNKRFKVKKAKRFFKELTGLRTKEAKKRLRKKFRKTRAKHEKAKRLSHAQLDQKEEKFATLSNLYLFEVEDGVDVKKAVAEFLLDPHVEYAQIDYKIEASYIPNDTYFPSVGSWGQNYADLWGLHLMQTQQAWDLNQGEGIVVAVVDTGIDYNHPDLADNMWINEDEIPGNGIDDDFNGKIDDIHGWDFVNDDEDPMDGHMHGTHVAGTIGAVGDNAEGVVGVAPKVKLMAAKGLSDSGSGTIFDLGRAIVYAAQNGARVINNSWGCSASCFEQPYIKEDIQVAQDLGSVVVFAAGNSSADVSLNSPQNLTYPKPIVVAASTQTDQPTYFTNFGHLVDVAAPGGGDGTGFSETRNILSTLSEVCSASSCNPQNDLIVNEKYLRIAGTSMSAPHVSGLAALILSRNPDLTPEEVRQVIRVSADDIQDPGFDFYSGTGRVNAYKALSVESPLSVKIESPLGFQPISSEDGLVDIIGTVSGDQLFSYELMYAFAGDPDNFISLTDELQQPVTHGLLGRINFSDLDEGVYILKLIARSISGEEYFDQLVLFNSATEAISQKVSGETYTSLFSLDVSNQLAAWVGLDVIENEEDFDFRVVIELFDFYNQQKLRVKEYEEPLLGNGQLIDLAASGQRIVWIEHPVDEEASVTTSRIMSCRYNSSTQTCPIQEIHSKSLPSDDGQDMIVNIAMDGNYLVWILKQDGQEDKVFSCTIQNDSCEEMLIASGEEDRLHGIDISGSLIVWQDAGLDKIAVYDRETNSLHHVDPMGSLYGNPRVDSNRIVWLDTTTDTFEELLAYCEFDPSDQSCPAEVLAGPLDFDHYDLFSYISNQFDISGDNVVYHSIETDGFSGIYNENLYFINLQTREEGHLTNSLRAEHNPRIFGKYLLFNILSGAWGFGDMHLAEINVAPELNNVPDLIAKYESTLAFYIHAKDPNGDIFDIIPAGLPEGAIVEEVLAGDFNEDGVVNDSDFDLFLLKFTGGSIKNLEDKAYDLNNDGQINLGDFSIFLEAISQEVDLNSLRVEFTPTLVQTGKTFSVDVRAEDEDGAFSEDHFNITVLQHTVSCFIATSSYGTVYEGKIDHLRDFRDEVLLNDTTGRQFVAWYYETSPEIADEVSERPWLQKQFRKVLAPMVEMTKRILMK